MRHRRKRSRSRTVGHRYEGIFSETEMERLLGKALIAGVITEFDTGRGTVVWYNGYPGQELRELTRQVESLVKR